MMTEIFGTTLPAIVDGTLRRDLRADDQRVQHARPLRLGELVGLPRPAQHVLDLLRARHRAVPVDSVGRAASQRARRPSIWLVYFYAATMIIFTMYGGGFATIPAYLADMFGTRYVGGIHGRLLTAWSLAGVLGPWRSRCCASARSTRRFATSSRTIDPAAFPAGVRRRHRPARRADRAADRDDREAHGDRAAGTVDPTPSLYNSTMYLMAALLAIALVANALMGPSTRSITCATPQAAPAR